LKRTASSRKLLSDSRDMQQPPPQMTLSSPYFQSVCSLIAKEEFHCVFFVFLLHQHVLLNYPFKFVLSLHFTFTLTPPLATFRRQRKMSFFRRLLNPSPPPSPTPEHSAGEHSATNNDDDHLPSSHLPSSHLPSSHQTSPSPPPPSKDSKYTTLLSSPNLNLTQLKALAWSSIPRSQRGASWRLLLHYAPTNKTRRETVLAKKRLEYWAMISQVGLEPVNDSARSGDPATDQGSRDPILSKQETLTLRQILVDLPRTCPSLPIFHQPAIQSLLKRVLYLWSSRNPACSYVQGINDVVCPIIWAFVGNHTEGSVGSFDVEGLEEGVLRDIEVRRGAYTCVNKEERSELAQSVGGGGKCIHSTPS